MHIARAINSRLHTLVVGVGSWLYVLSKRVGDGVVCRYFMLRRIKCCQITGFTTFVNTEFLFLGFKTNFMYVQCVPDNTHLSARP